MASEDRRGQADGDEEDDEVLDDQAFDEINDLGQDDENPGEDDEEEEETWQV